MNPPITGDHAPCASGSGKKFKDCCTAAPAGVRLDQFLQTAQTAVAQGDFAAAEQAFRAALQVQGDSPAALAGLGQSLCRNHRLPEGIALLKRAGKILTRQAGRHGDCRHLLALAWQLQHWHAPEEALPLAQAVLRIHPGHANAHHLAAQCLQQLHRHEEAYRHARRTAELAPTDANAATQLAVLEARLGQPEQAKSRLQGALEHAGQADRPRVHRELGAVLDRLGEYEQAFAHLAIAGQLTLQSREAGRIDAQAVFRELAAARTDCDADFLATAKPPADGLPAPVFLLGFYRSGTTLAERILDAHPKVAGSDEARLIPPVLAELYRITAGRTAAGTMARLKALDQADVVHLRKFYWDTAAAGLGKRIAGKILVDKTALNTLNLELINTLFPEAPLVFMLRDPRDVCLSCFMQPFGLTNLTANFLTWEGTARFYALIMDHWLGLRGNLALRWQEIRYEDLLHNMQGCFDPVFAAMGLQWSPACAAFDRHTRGKAVRTPSFDQVARPLYHSSAGRWRHYPQPVRDVLPLLQPYLAAFGYAAAD